MPQLFSPLQRWYYRVQLEPSPFPKFPSLSVPYPRLIFFPGSTELADSLAKAMLESNLIQLRNHGQVTGGMRMKCQNRAVLFERAVRSLHRFKNLSVIPAHDVALLQQRGRETRGALPFKRMYQQNRTSISLPLSLELNQFHALIKYRV